MAKKFAEHKGLNLSEVNKSVLNEWDEKDLFHKSMSEREGCPSFVFFEGPPSANGMPGIHHVMARSIKDTFCRYKTMQGFQVKRKAGWDTHGLPVELGVEKALGITKEDIGSRNAFNFTQSSLYTLLKWIWIAIYRTIIGTLISIQENTGRTTFELVAGTTIGFQCPDIRTDQIF